LELKFFITNINSGRTIKMLTKNDILIPLNIFKFEIRKMDQHIELETLEKIIFKAKTINAKYKKRAEYDPARINPPNNKINSLFT